LFFFRIYHEQGIGVHPDYAIALEWFSRSASKGYGPAEDKLNAPTNKRKSISNFENKYKRSNKRYYDESVRIAEKSRRATVEQTCQMM
jgi:TPR repeat protein